MGLREAAECPHMPVFVLNSHLLEGLAVVDDGDHVLDIAVRVLPVSQVLLLIQLSFVFVSEDAQPAANTVRG